MFVVPPGGSDGDPARLRLFAPMTSSHSGLGPFLLVKRPNRIRPPSGITLLKQGCFCDVVLEIVVFLESRKRFLISDWQRQCPRPMVQMNPVMQPADDAEGATPYCWSWRLDFLFLAPQLVRCIMRCNRSLYG